MNVFELFASITLDKTNYEKGLKSASVLTETEASKMRNSLLEMQNANKKAMDNLIKDFASGKINITDYNKELSKIKSSNSEIENTASSMGISLVENANKAKIAWMAVATAIVAVGKQINQLMRDSMNYADTVGDLAAKYGVSTDAISEMQYIADQSSTSIEGMTSAMTMLLNRAKENGEGFKELGVDVYDANGNLKQMDELFYETIGALNAIESDGEKSRLMLETFGRSAMTVGEVVRKSSEELAQMRQEAHDFGVVMDEETINFASDMNDALAVLKLQGQSALASLVAGAPDAEEKLQNFIDNILEMLDGYIPAFVNFSLRLLLQVALGLIRTAPSLAIEIVTTIMDVILNMDWFQFGVDLGKSILEGLINIIVSTLNRVLGVFGVNIPKVDLGVGENVFNEESLGEEYEISENIRQDITVKVEASGDSAVSEETAEKTAEALAPYIDKILGGK